jgi:hypothetical protein
MPIINTTTGAVEVPRGTRESTGHTINTSAVVEEDLQYLDEEPEVVQVLNAAGWAATFEDGHHEELLFWCVLDDETVHGVVLGEGGLVDLAQGNARTRPGFTGYTQVNNDKKEQ